MAKATRTVRCRACGHDTPCDMDQWVDFGDWAGGRPKSIACPHCGEQIVLPTDGARGGRDASGERSVWLMVVGVLLLAVVAVLGVLLLRLAGG